MQEFNKGVYDYIIASDESAVVPAEQVDEDENDEDEETAGMWNNMNLPLDH